MTVEVLRAGTMTTVQDWPGRLGLWHVGVPPSGPMDDRSFRLGNRVLGNPAGAPGLECTLTGPRLRFGAQRSICVSGADAAVTLDGQPVPRYEPIRCPAGSVLDVGKADGRGLRVYVLFAGGLDVPLHLGSASTFTLGRFGGHEGRPLRKGDLLCVRDASAVAPAGGVGPLPELTHDWELTVTEGPHAAPDFFTEEDIEELYSSSFQVHFNSARTGVRLVGPAPRWARLDGGEAGLHPSNIHDTPYGLGAIDFTGNVPIILGPDGPSLGGFVCPAVVVSDERWKLGQLRPGDTVRFRPLTDEATRSAVIAAPGGERDNGVLHRREAYDDVPSVTYRRTGDDNLLIEYGPMTLDLGLRMRVYALAQRIAAERAPGLLDVTAGIRSLQLHVDRDTLTVRDALALALAAEDDLPATGELSVPSRRVSLPLSWDDPATREAIERYMSGVRADAPWCPWNIDFIRRINGLETVEQVRDIVFAADYLVLGLGDVYLGAPVATPIDPRHRLVTTKYNPARTWTPESAVGIGGAYLCVYGLEGPGGYQLLGRTVPVWRRDGAEPPWLLREFDRISWYPVSAEELTELRADPQAGAGAVWVESGEFDLAAHRRFLAAEAGAIAGFAARQSAAFAAERSEWEAAGEVAASTA